VSEIVNAVSLIPGDVILRQGVQATILRPKEDFTETVEPLTGRPGVRFWCRREDTGQEGWMTYGLTGVAQILRRTRKL
jgi:hypothetical protein